MSRRAFPALVVLLAGIAALVVVTRDEPLPTEPVFAELTGAWMPSVSEAGALTESWFCPGVPATADDGVGGEVVIANRNDSEVVGRFAVLTSEGVQAEQGFEVGPSSRTTVDVDAFVEADFASVVVEVEGGGAFVEQRALHPAGNSVSACSDTTSDEWYLADGFTLDGSIETILLTNPFDESVVADLRFSTEAGETSPAAFKGFTVPPRSVKTVRIAELGARDEPVIAAAVETSAGRLVVGRAQHYLGGGRSGYDVSLAAPALRDQFWFADGEKGPEITEQYAIYNPTDEDVVVDVVLLGLPARAEFGNVEPIDVPAREVVVYDPNDSTTTGNIPRGRHAAVFSTLAEPSVVVERVINRPASGTVATEVLLGAPPRIDGYVATQWHVGIGPTEPTEDALVLYNLDQADATVTVWAVRDGGPFAVPSLTDIPVGPGSVATIDLVADAVLDRELIVSSSNRLFLERRLPRGTGLEGYSASWTLPANAPVL